MNRGILILSVLLLTLLLAGCKQDDQLSQQQNSSGDPSETPAVESVDYPMMPDTASNQDSNTTDAKTLAPLISATELSELLKSDTTGLRVLEPGKDAADYKSGHLPNAQFVHWVDDMTNSKDLVSYRNPAAAEFVSLMSRLGIENDDRIVIYDRLSSRLSTRLYWTLRYFGHANVQVLNGGFEAWNRSFELSTDKPEVAESQYKMAVTNDQLLAEIKFVSERLNDPKARLIDGRPTEQYSGKTVGKIFHTGQEHPRKGHIPGAVNVVWASNFNEDGTFKSSEELKAIYQDVGVLPDQCVITYCNEGLHAAPPWFVLTQLLDFKDVRLYDSSMAEWAKSEYPLEKSADEKTKPVPIKDAKGELQL